MAASTFESFVSNLFAYGISYYISFWFIFLVLFFIILPIILFSRTVFLVNQTEVIIIERLGKFHKILYPGFHVIIPFIDVPREYFWSVLKLEQISGRAYRYDSSSYRIDLREAVFDFPKQNVITKDNVTMEISAILYYQIVDPKRTLYEIQNLPESIEKLVQTKLREIIGSLDLDGTLVSRDLINEKLRENLSCATDKWGVKVTRVELQDINPPKDIRTAMEKQMRAERDRRASVLEAEGEKQAAVLRAEGERMAKVEKALGDAEAKRLIAEGEANARKIIAESEAIALMSLAKANPGVDPAKYFLAMHYMDSLKSLSAESKTVVIPYEATSLLGAVSTVKEIFGNNPANLENIPK